MQRPWAAVLIGLLAWTAIPACGFERELNPFERAAQSAPRQQPAPEAGPPGPPRTWRVGPSRKLKRPSEAARRARSGDTVEIEAATYAGDVAVWPQHNLTIRGIGGGRAVLPAEGKAADSRGIWVLRGNEVRVERIEFAGAKLAARNGAGIAHEGGNLTVVDCVFRDNENGILAVHPGDADAAIRVERSEFARNGAGDGYSHGIYVGRLASLTLIGNDFHETAIGHLVKSRARRNVIAFNRIMDRAQGSSSYAIDLPEGGIGYIVGNLIQQGPRSENPSIIAFMMERQHAASELYVINNTIVNELGHGVFVNSRGGHAVVANNIMVGGGAALEGVGELVHNLLAEYRGRGPTLPSGLNRASHRGNRRVPDAGLLNPAAYDYRIASGSPATGIGADPRQWLDNAPLQLDAQFAVPLGVTRRRAGATFDIGALAPD
jgi:hypothetical protein